MDPDATLRAIEEAVCEEDLLTASDLCEELDDWLNRGGFEPDWETFPLGFEFFESYLGGDVR